MRTYIYVVISVSIVILGSVLIYHSYNREVITSDEAVKIVQSKFNGVGSLHPSLVFLRFNGTNYIEYSTDPNSKTIIGNGYNISLNLTSKEKPTNGLVWELQSFAGKCVPYYLYYVDAETGKIIGTVLQQWGGCY